MSDGAVGVSNTASQDTVRSVLRCEFAVGKAQRHVNHNQRQVQGQAGGGRGSGCGCGGGEGGCGEGGDSGTGEGEGAGEGAGEGDGEGPPLVLTIVGDGFLMHMVRIVCGTLLQVGLY